MSFYAGSFYMLTESKDILSVFQRQLVQFVENVGDWGYKVSSQSGNTFTVKKGCISIGEITNPVYLVQATVKIVGTDGRYTENLLLENGVLRPTCKYSNLLNNLITNTSEVYKIEMSYLAGIYMAEKYRKEFHPTDNQLVEWHIPYVNHDGYEYFDPKGKRYIRFTSLEAAVFFIRIMHLEKLDTWK